MPDPLGPFKGGARTTAIGSRAGASTVPTPAMCSTVDRKLDDRINDPRGSSEPVIKVIYARPRDLADNRIDKYYPVIQSGARAMSDFVQSESGGRLAVKFDLGTFEGPDCLDVQHVELPFNAAFYSKLGADAFRQVASDIRARLGPQPTQRNYIVYADMVAPSGLAGQAEIWDDRNEHSEYARFDGVRNLHDEGGFMGVAFGRGGTDFFGSGVPFPRGATSRTQVETVLHEIMHTLGAVQWSADHTSFAHHCNDEYDLMCYADGGASSHVFVDSHCDGEASMPADSYGPNLQALDCGKNDYFDPFAFEPYFDQATFSIVQPPLWGRWNVADSLYLCPAAACAPADVGPPDTRIVRAPGKTTQNRRVRLRFRASERSRFSCRVDAYPAHPCRSPFTVRLRNRGNHRIRVSATDLSGNAEPIPASVRFRLLKPG